MTTTEAFYNMSQERVDKELGRNGISISMPDPAQLFEVMALDPQESSKALRYLVIASSIEEATITARNHLWRLLGHGCVIESVTSKDIYVNAISESLFLNGVAFRNTFGGNTRID